MLVAMTAAAVPTCSGLQVVSPHCIRRKRALYAGVLSTGCASSICTRAAGVAATYTVAARSVGPHDFTMISAAQNLAKLVMSCEMAVLKPVATSLNV